MNNNLTKILIAGLVGGVVLFFMGFLIYAVALDGFFKSQTTQDMSRPSEEMIWWALILGNLSWGVLLAYIFGQWANITIPMTGLKAGAILGLLMGGGFDFVMYATADTMTLTAGLVDIIATGVMMGVGGAAVAWMLGRGAK